MATCATVKHLAPTHRVHVVQVAGFGGADAGPNKADGDMLPALVAEMVQYVAGLDRNAGYITLPHVHPIDENITVVKGNWSLGMGRRFNRSALEPMETGTFGMAPKNMAHFAWSKTETILQVHGIGPFASTVVEPVYELTDKGIFS